VNEQQLAEIKQRAEQAAIEITSLTDGKPFTMCIPVQDTDSDVVLFNSIADFPALFDYITQLQAEIAAMTGTK
jgi:hypothetical protein